MAKPRKRILCIEDDRETAALIAEELADREFEVSTACDGQEGFVAILKDKPDLVLCDIGVPIMSGFEVLERLTELAPRLGRVPFVFLTALADRGVARTKLSPKLPKLNEREIEALTWVARG